MALWVGITSTDDTLHDNLILILRSVVWVGSLNITLSQVCKIIARSLPPSKLIMLKLGTCTPSGALRHCNKGFGPSLCPTPASAHTQTCGRLRNDALRVGGAASSATGCSSRVQQNRLLRGTSRLHAAAPEISPAAAQPPSVRVDNDADPNYTVVAVRCPHRPGLLPAMSSAFRDLCKWATLTARSGSGDVGGCYTMCTLLLHF